MALAGLLEWLEALTPDRTPDLQAALYSAGGVLAAALVAELFIRVLRPVNGRAFLMQPLFRLPVPISINSLTRLLP